MTLKKCRKALEEDMGLDPGGLDDHKDYVRDLIEMVKFCTITLHVMPCCTVCLSPISG